MKKILMTSLSVCSLGVSCNEMSDTPMLLVVPSPYRSCIIIQDLKWEGGHFLHLWKIDCTSISVKGGENVFC